MASFKSNIKKVYTALSKLPGVLPTYDGLGFPISMERHQAYMFFRAECPEGQNPFLTTMSFPQAYRKALPYINKAAISIRKALGIDNSYKFRDVSSKLSTLQRGMIYPDWRKSLDYYLENDPYTFESIPRGALSALLGVPTEIGTINWYIRYSGWYKNSCAEFYIEVTGPEIKDNANDTFTIAPELTVGSVLVSSWGYSMTIVDFYQVVKRTNSFVYLKELMGTTVEDNGPGGSLVRPTTQFADSTIYRAKIVVDKYDSNGGWYIRAPQGHGILHAWDGKDVYENRWD